MTGSRRSGATTTASGSGATSTSGARAPSTRCATPAPCSSSSSTTDPGRGASWPTTASAPTAPPSSSPPLVADLGGQPPRLPHPVPDLLGRGRASGEPLLPVVGGQARVQVGRVLRGQRRHVVHVQLLEHQAEHGADPAHP